MALLHYETLPSYIVAYLVVFSGLCYVMIHESLIDKFKLLLSTLHIFGEHSLIHTPLVIFHPLHYRTSPRLGHQLKFSTVENLIKLQQHVKLHPNMSTIKSIHPPASKIKTIDEWNIFLAKSVYSKWTTLPLKGWNHVLQKSEHFLYHMWHLFVVSNKALGSESWFANSHVCCCYYQYKQLECYILDILNLSNWL